MHPIERIARREIAESWRDGRLKWSAVSLVLLLLIAFSFGWHTYAVRSKQRQAIQDSERIRWLAQSGRSPHTASHQGVYVFRPEPLLLALDCGVDSYFGIATHAEDEQHFFEWKPAEDELVAHRFGEVSVAAILEFMLPLLLVVLLYSTFSRDRETGILRLAMSLGVKRSQYVTGKLIGGLAPAFALLPAVLLIVMALRFLAGKAAFDSALPALLWMMAAFLLLFATFCFLSLGVSARAHSSRSSLLFLLLFWCFTSFVIPHVATSLAERWQPTPTPADVLAALNQAATSGQNRDDLIRAIGIELMHQYGAPDIAHLPLSPVGVQMWRSAGASEPVTSAAYDLAYRSYLRRERVMQWMSLASPMLSVQSLSTALAKTGPNAMVDVAHAAERYRFDLVRTMDADIAEHRNPTLPVNTLADDYHVGREVWSRVPAFQYQQPALHPTLVEHQIAFVLSGIWCVAAGLFAAVSIAQMKVDA